MKLSIIKAVHDAMQAHLVNLLFEEYKQIAFFEKLEKAGVTFTGLAQVDNWSVVVDFIGFPKDNALEGSSQKTEDSDLGTQEIFSRQWLFDNYAETLTKIPRDQNLTINEGGDLTLSEKICNKTAKYLLAAHVLWLFTEYEKLLDIIPM